MKRLTATLIALVALCAMAGPAMASATRDAEAIRLAGAELGNTKRLLQARQDQLTVKADRAMAKCRSRGKGWKRIRKLRDPAQRRLYTSGARVLFKDLRTLAEQNARFQPVEGYMARYVNRLESSGVTDPVLLRGIAAQRVRLTAQAAVLKLGICKTFESRLKKVRNVRRRHMAQAEFDSAAGAVYAYLARYAQAKEDAAARRYENALDAAWERMVALGVKEPDANGFLYALSVAR